MVLKSENEIQSWLTETHFFEWTTVTANLESSGYLRFNISFDDTREKVGGEKYNHWDVEFLVKGFTEIYRLFHDWQQANAVVKKELDVVEYITHGEGFQQIP